MLDSYTVWDGAIRNDPDGGNSKGLLLDPRNSPRPRFLTTESLEDIGFNAEVFEAGVRRLIGTMTRKPLGFDDYQVICFADRRKR